MARRRERFLTSPAGIDRLASGFQADLAGLGYPAYIGKIAWLWGSRHAAADGVILSCPAFHYPARSVKPGWVWAGRNPLLPASDQNAPLQPSPHGITVRLPAKIKR